MRQVIQRNESYTQPVSPSVAFDVLTFVKSELLAQDASLASDSVFEVTSEPRGTYTGVTVFVEREHVDAVISLAKLIEDRLEELGYRSLIAVRTWSGIQRP